jgi:uncharacterized protein YwqG
MSHEDQGGPTYRGREDLRHLARRMLGSDDGDLVADLALPAVLLDHSVAPGGRSRLGGAPLLEASQEWPHWGERPLSFVALLDVEDVAGFDLSVTLPRRGLFNFFYEAEEQMAWGFDPEHAGGWRVLVADPALAAVREPPGGAPQFTECTLAPRPVLTLPDPAETVLDEVRQRQADVLYELQDEWGRYANVVGPRGVGGHLPHHQLGGWPFLVQNSLQTECQLASNGIVCGTPLAYTDPGHAEVRRGAGDWRLLLHIDSDDAAGWMWGDVGSLYYCVNRPSIDTATLDAVWMIFQCC